MQKGFKGGLRVGVFSAALLASCSVFADTIIDYTYLGTVNSNGIDPNGTFGNAGSSLAGDAFDLVFQFDLNAGVFVNSGGGQQLYGPATAQYPGDPSGGSPLVNASLTINGRTAPIYGNGYSSAMQEADAYFQVVTRSAASDPVQGNVTMTTTEQDSSSFPILGINDQGIYVSYNGLPPYSAYIYTTAGTFSVAGASGGLTASSLTISDVAPVPIPASAWLMLSGLGGLGVVARRRHTV